MDKSPCVYMLASKRNGTLYTGVTSNLPMRMAQHKAGDIDGFARKYGVGRLVWFERPEMMVSAIAREKRPKKWNRVEDTPDDAR